MEFCPHSCATYRRLTSVVAPAPAGEDVPEAAVPDAPPPPPPAPRATIGQVSKQLGRVQADVTELRGQLTTGLQWMRETLTSLCEGLDIPVPPYPPPPSQPE